MANNGALKSTPCDGIEWINQVDSADDESHNNVNSILTIKTNMTMAQFSQIPLIVEGIIQKIVTRLNDLKHCRLVNRMWTKIATNVMLKADTTRVVINLDRRILKYQHFIPGDCSHNCLNMSPLYYLQGEHDDVDHHHEQSDDLITLKDIVSKSSVFPSSTFLMYGGSLKYPGVQEFFKVVGQHVKELMLIKVNGKSMECFASLLSVDCPNLETLEIKGGDNIQWNYGQKSFRLEKLKTLKLSSANVDAERIEGPFKMLSTICAPNLQVLHQFYLSRDYGYTIKTGKEVYSIKELYVVGVEPPDGFTMLNKLITVVNLKLNFLMIHISGWFDRADNDKQRQLMALIRQLLYLSRTTLKSLLFMGMEDAFENLEFPQLCHLEDIEIILWSQVQGRGSISLPSKILRNTVSPNLQEIKKFDLNRDMEQVVGAEKIHCVKHVTVDIHKVPMQRLRLFTSAGPRLQMLTLILRSSLNALQVNVTMAELAEQLEQLLKLSKDTVKCLEIIRIEAQVELTFPVLSRLELLVLSITRARIFSRGINLTQTFPTLKMLDVRSCPDLEHEDSWNLYFPPPDAFVGIMTSVNTIIVHKKISKFGKSNIKMICPLAKIVYSDV